MSDPLMPLPTRQGLVARIQGILLKPAETWDVIAVEPASIQSIFAGYVAPLAAIGPVCHVIGSSLIGVGAFGFGYRTPLLWSIVGAVVGYALALAAVYVMALVIDALAPGFDGRKDRLSAFKLVAYSGTPGYLAGVFLLFMPLVPLAILVSLYGVYLLYLGLPKLMRNPADKTVVYLIVAVICRIVLGAIVAWIVGLTLLIGGGAAVLGAGHFAGNGPGGSFTIHDRSGSATIDVNQMAAAANQMAAQASAIRQNGAPAAPVKVADASALLTLMPPIFDGATRADTSTSSGGVAGVSASTAEASYAVGGGSIRLKVSDIGSMTGVAAMANAMHINSSSSSAGGYETVKTDGNLMTTERYSTAAKDGEYTVMRDGRVTVSAQGSGVDMATLKSLVGQVDLSKAEALTE